MSIHGPTHWDSILHEEFEDESDRACVILAAALLDSALETLLRELLVACSTSEDPLFDSPNAPLASLSTRIEMAYRTGIIDSVFARNLHLVRKIRNDFAHNVSGCTFSDSAVVSRLTELKRSSGLPEQALEMRKGFPRGARGDFQMIVSWMQWMLRSRCEDLEPLSSLSSLPGSVFEYRASKKKKSKKHARAEPDVSKQGSDHSGQ